MARGTVKHAQRSDHPVHWNRKLRWFDDSWALLETVAAFDLIIAYIIHTAITCADDLQPPEVVLI